MGCLVFHCFECTVIFLTWLFSWSFMLFTVTNNSDNVFKWACLHWHRFKNGIYGLKFMDIIILTDVASRPLKKIFFQRMLIPAAYKSYLYTDVSTEHSQAFKSQNLIGEKLYLILICFYFVQHLFICVLLFIIFYLPHLLNWLVPFSVLCYIFIHKNNKVAW